jgi:two-component system nitrogen regulation sensor histidine kinase GlnL
VARDLSGVLDSVLAGIVVLDADGRVERANPAACRILEQSQSSAAGRPVEALLGEGHALSRLAREVLATGRSAAESEVPVERRSEAPLAVDIAVSPLFDDAGHRDGAVVFLRDSTLRRDLEKVASERAHLSAFGRIAAGVAHEVKNPLGGIRGAAEILASRSNDAKTLDAAELIVREVDRIAGLLDDLLIFSHDEVPQLEPTNIHRLLDDVLALVGMDPVGRGVQVERLFDPSIPEILLDPDRMTQVFLNLARNALQAMEGRGTLTISTRMRLDRRITTPEGEQYPTLAIEVADTGPGIPDELLAELGTPFFTTRPGGTGLGLAVSMHWVARHDGTLRLDTRVGAGTCARVELPLRIAA